MAKHDALSRKIRYEIFTAFEKGVTVPAIASRYRIDAGMVYRVHREEAARRGKKAGNRMVQCAVCCQPKRLDQVVESQRLSGLNGEAEHWYICHECNRVLTQRAPVRQGLSVSDPCSRYSLLGPQTL